MNENQDLPKDVLVDEQSPEVSSVEENMIQEEVVQQDPPLTDDEIDDINKLTPEQEQQLQQYAKDVEKDCLFRTLSEAMNVLEFKSESIKDFLTSPYYNTAVNADHATQRAEIIMYVLRKFTMATELLLIDGEVKHPSQLPEGFVILDEHKIGSAPGNIRMSLVENESINMWIADMVAGILPYLKDNEDIYFPPFVVVDNEK